jgi:DeoR/GlpR family transcriptional regulator of sugar metabolism
VNCTRRRCRRSALSEKPAASQVEVRRSVEADDSACFGRLASRAKRRIARTIFALLGADTTNPRRITVPNEDNAAQLIVLLKQSQSPTVTAKAAKTETGKPIQNTTGHSVDVFINFTGKGEIKVKLLNAAKEATGLEIVEQFAASTKGVVQFRVPAGWYYEPEFTEGTAGEATFVTGA